MTQAITQPEALQLANALSVGKLIDDSTEWAFSLALKYHPEPVAWYVTGCSTLLDEHDAKAEAKRCGGSAKAVPLYSIPD